MDSGTTSQGRATRLKVFHAPGATRATDPPYKRSRSSRVSRSSTRAAGSVPATDDVDPFLDPKLLASAGAVRTVWTESDSSYPINATDANFELGPLLGRYPSDYYDGDTNDPRTPGHPWALCTSAFAEFNFRVAAAIKSTNAAPSGPWQ